MEYSFAEEIKKSSTRCRIRCPVIRLTGERQQSRERIAARAFDAAYKTIASLLRSAEIIIKQPIRKGSFHESPSGKQSI
jgi:hypothetical protein